MGEQNITQYNDSLVDAMCVVALITIAVADVLYFLLTR